MKKTGKGHDKRVLLVAFLVLVCVFVGGVVPGLVAKAIFGDRWSWWTGLSGSYWWTFSLFFCIVVGVVLCVLILSGTEKKIIAAKISS